MLGRNRMLIVLTLANASFIVIGWLLPFLLPGAIGNMVPVNSNSHLSQASLASSPMESAAAVTPRNEFLLMVLFSTNSLTAIAYASIPVSLVVFVYRRKDIPFSWVFVMFGAFILACGTTHAMHAISIWKNMEMGWQQAIADSLTAVISVLSAIVIWPLLPRLLSIPSPAQLRAVNQELQHEKARLEQAQRELSHAYAEVEQRVKERTAELVEANQSLQAEIAERQKAEDALRMEHIKSLQYFDNAAVLMVVLNTKAEIAQLNRKGYDTLEYREGELTGRNWFKTCLPVHDYGQVQQVFDQWITGHAEAVEVYENAILTRSGAEKLIRWHNSFVRDAQGDIAGVLASGEDITERRRAEEQIRNSLAEKETLLRELHHRTKNNMGVIIALLDLQMADIDDERLQSAFDDTQNRIRSMALVHQKLYESRDLSRINLKDYIIDLVDLLMTSYEITPGRVAVTTEMEDLLVLIDTVIPCGLILNELISNALKYAFPGERGGEIKIRMRRLENGEILLGVSDNGVGLPPGFDIRRHGHMGMQTIFALAENQMYGKVSFETQQGVACQIQFRDDLYQPRV